MFKRLMNLFLIVIMVFLTNTSEVFGKGGGSRSSSSRSAGRSYSSGSASKGSSFATRPSSTPQAKSSSGKQYSSGSPSVSKSSPPSSKQYSPPVASGANGSKYSSGFTPSPSSPGKKYTAGSPPPSTGPPVANNSADGNSRKPISSDFNAAMSSDAKRVDSQSRYVAATAPKPTYTSKGTDGKSVQQIIKPDSPQVQTVRKTVTHERYVTYDNRANTFYGGGFSPMSYHDPFSPFLMGWIMSDAINSHQRAEWMYHHQSDMDQERYSEMLRKDAKLQAEIDQLKAQNVVRDPSYVPPQMVNNPDLMFNKEFIDASYNPVEVESSESATNTNAIGSFLFFVFMIVVVGGLAVYFFFMKEY